MNKNKYVLSVLPSPRPKNYPLTVLSDKKELEKKLNELGEKIELNEALKGGFVSQVYSANLNGKKVVVKHVENLTPFDPTEFFIDKNGLVEDVRILKLLAKSRKIRTPKIIRFFPKINSAIQEDLREEGFFLLNDQIIDGKLNVNSAGFVGESLANLAAESRIWKEFKTNESSEQSIYERGLELRLAYPNSQKEYLFLEKEFLGNNKYFCWPDGHPKNILVKKSGECAFIDFGRSVWADQRYMLPNFLAHIVVYCLAGYIDKKLAEQYILKSVSSYKSIEPINENIFCQYLAMEVLHRANGKWVAGIDTRGKKLALLKFGMTVFDEKVFSINELLRLLL